MPVKELGPHFQFASWRVPQFPRAIEYPLEVTEEIRAFACDELLQLSHGGDEVGGVLFGTRRDDLVRILTWRPIACEHLDGATLRLSYNDRMNLAVQLEVARQNSDLKDLRPLGWFVSHFSGEVALSPSDLEIYNGFFPEAWQVTLVICPQGNGRAKAGFFVREPDGKLQSESSYQCFELDRLNSPEPLRAAASTSESASAKPPVSPAPAFSATERAALSMPATTSSSPVRVTKLEEVESPMAPRMPLENAGPQPSYIPPPPSWPPLRPPSPTPFSPPLPQPQSAPLPPPLSSPLAPPSPGLHTPSFQIDDEVPRRERWLWAVPILLALGIAAFVLYQRHAETSNGAVALRAWSEGQSVQLAWDANSRAIRDSYRGEIEINDGSKDSHVSLTTDQLHAGKLTYLPQSGDVTFAMTVYTTNGDSTRDSTRVIAPALATPAEAAPSFGANPTTPPVAPIAPGDTTAPPAPPVATDIAPPADTAAQTLPATGTVPPASPTADQSALQQQVQQLKIEVSKQRARADELQNLVRILENRLGIESGRRP